MPKSPDAFRTISEVADWLGIQAHVLRFWESKFTQVKPIKRAGGRRYYRPADMQLLGGIKKLLHEDGLTIKGVQKILREEGMSHVAAMSVSLDDEDGGDIQATVKPTPAPRKEPEPEEAVVLPFEAPKEPERVKTPTDSTDTEATVTDAPKADTASPQEPTTEEDVSVDTPDDAAAIVAAQTKEDETPSIKDSPVEEPVSETPVETGSEHAASNEPPVEDAPAEAKEEATEDAAPVPELTAEPVADDVQDSGSADSADTSASETSTPKAVEVAPDQQQEPVVSSSASEPVETPSESKPTDATETLAETEPAEAQSPPVAQDTPEEQPPAADASGESDDAPTQKAATEFPIAQDTPSAEAATDKATPTSLVEAPAAEPVEPVKETSAPLPSFLRSPPSEQPSMDAVEAPSVDDTGATSAPVEAPQQAEPVTETSEPEEPLRPKARDIGMPNITPEAEIHAESAALTRATQISKLDTASAAQVKPLLAQLSALRDRMAARSGGAQPKS